ncbi:hypothetical protein A2Z10_01595 [Candidatus Azambacteria bacterium RBG_16_47_10]|uniref:NIF system FeS cluster assembly NifU N-terminal domain-containing protein n=1 Tax=Candidatus Azambacteria bacterium RBG_16_47_10 TaxID=1797292 RepID=A0A1F5AZM8_9BACT|nr:MAG: hypothetical protein A2Z10_01595 [Candidatus Azambacteria bacterium RBG_16_47_10]
MKIDQLKKLQEYAQLSPYAGTMKKPDIHWEGENPLCGDMLSIDLRVVKGKVADARFEHRGCALSGAATSIFLDHIIGKQITALSRITLEKHLALLGIPVSPGRLNCALLPLRGIRGEGFKPLYIRT